MITASYVIFCAGFIATWLGMVLLIVPMVFRALSAEDPRNLFTYSFRNYPERLQNHGESIHKELNTVGKTKAGHRGSVLVAIGTSLLMLAGIVWIIERILQN